MVGASPARFPGLSLSALVFPLRLPLPSHWSVTLGDIPPFEFSFGPNIFGPLEMVFDSD